MAYTIYAPERKVPVRGVLFDMDGLVLDTEKLYSRFWQEAAQSLGYPMTRQQALGMRALNSAAGQQQLCSYFGPDVSYSQVRAVRIEKMDAYIALHGVEAKPGIRELLTELENRHIGVALATASPRERIRDYLTPLGLFDRFPVICSGYEVAHGKPEPDIFLEAARRLELNPENCMVLEDSPSGLLAAHRAGCLPVMVPDQDQPDGATLPLLYAKADSLTDVIDLLR